MFKTYATIAQTIHGLAVKWITNFTRATSYPGEEPYGFSHFSGVGV